MMKRNLFKSVSADENREAKRLVRTEIKKAKLSYKDKMRRNVTAIT